MATRVGWRCRSCLRYYQLPPGTSPPAQCRHCGAWGAMRRIDHSHVPSNVAVGDTVVCDVVGQVRQTIVGDVVAVTADRVLVDACDGTGHYEVTPEQIIRRRS